MCIIKISNDFSYQINGNILLSIDENGLNILSGKIYGILGENGSGKTTLLNIINSFLSPTSGKIEYNIKRTKYVNSYNSGVNINLIADNIRRSFQVPLLVDNMSILNNIIISRRSANEKFISSFKKNDNNEYSELNLILNLFNLNGETIVKNLSYGQRRIISNLQVIYSKPSIALLDEPFSNIHEDKIKELKRLYSDLVKEKTTIIIVEHVKKNLIDFVDEIIFIKNKRIAIK